MTSIDGALQAALQSSIELKTDVPGDPTIERIGEVVDDVLTAIVATYNSQAAAVGIPEMDIRRRTPGSRLAPFFSIALEDHGSLSIALTTEIEPALLVALSARDVFDTTEIQRFDRPVSDQTAAGVTTDVVRQWLSLAFEVRTA